MSVKKKKSIIMRFDTTKTLGILGGGQLGKMLVQSAMEFDLYIKSMDADPSAPCAIYAHEFFCGSLLDFDQVVQFGLTCDILTIEIEHVNVDALYTLEKEGKKVYPQPRVLEAAVEMMARAALPAALFGFGQGLVLLAQRGFGLGQCPAAAGNLFVGIAQLP